MEKKNSKFLFYIKEDEKRISSSVTKGRDQIERSLKDRNDRDRDRNTGSRRDEMEVDRRPAPERKHRSRTRSRSGSRGGFKLKPLF